MSQQHSALAESRPPDPPQAPNVLLSINPEWAEAILDGEKQWEYRKTPPARGPPMRLVLYASAPVQAAVGVAWSYTMLERDVPVLIDETVDRTPHDRDDVLDYFGDAQEGAALRIGSFRRFDEPVPRTDLESDGLAPAQNFRYIGSVPAHETLVEPTTVRVGGHTRVGHCKRDETDVYVGRGPNGRAMDETPVGERGWLGNPYPLDDVDSRGASIEAFRADFVARLKADQAFRDAVRGLSGKTLGCWCQSLEADQPACHAEVVAEYADRLAGGEQL